MKIVLKLIHMHIIKIHHFRRDSGLSKFGVTPGGGAIAGFGWPPALLASIMNIFKNKHPSPICERCFEYDAGKLDGDAGRK